jgi:hypothetical protein
MIETTSTRVEAAAAPWARREASSRVKLVASPQAIAPAI